MGFVGECLAPASTACDRLPCRQPNGSCATFVTVQPPNGTRCGAGNQCNDGTCVPTERLTIWDWSVGDFGVCSNGLQTRTVTCVANTAATGMDASCPQPRPITVQNCP